MDPRILTPRLRGYLSTYNRAPISGEANIAPVGRISFCQPRVLSDYVYSRNYGVCEYCTGFAPASRLCNLCWKVGGNLENSRLEKIPTEVNRKINRKNTD